MLTLDFRTISEEEASEQIAARCASFGTATILRVEFPDHRTAQGAAVIKMSSYEEASNLVSEFGGSRCGTKVIIRLFQEGAVVPSFSRKNQVFGSVEEGIA